jgi:hypothetical protein
MDRAHQGGGTTRGRACFALAFLALTLQLMFPAGFMAASPGAAKGAFPIVICTAQGAMTADWTALGGPADSKAKSPAKSKAGAVCAFAGHASAPSPQPALALAAPVVFASAPQSLVRQDLFPGRGLAAPPPPAIGPPALS